MTRYGGGGINAIHARLERRYRNMAQKLTDKDNRVRVVWTGTARTRKGLEPAVWMTFGDEPAGEHVYFVKCHYTTAIGRLIPQEGDLAQLVDVSHFQKDKKHE